MGLEQSPLFTRSTALFQPDAIESMSRYGRWQIFFNIFDQSIVKGLGPGGWGKYVMIGAYRYPHNILIEFVIEYGLIGIISFLLIFLGGIRVCVEIMRDLNRNFYTKAIALSWIFYATSSMFSGSFIQGDAVFFAITGIIAGLRVNTSNTTRYD